MKKSKLILVAILTTILLLVSPGNIKSDSRQAIIFKETRCSVCQSLVDEGYITKMEDQGITVIFYDIQSSDVVPEYSYTDNSGTYVEVTAIDVFAAFNITYRRTSDSVPALFVGDSYFEDYDEITEAIDRGTVFDLSDDPLLEVIVEEGQAFGSLSGFIGFLIVLGAGLLDGFNPCAIALLLLFIGLLVNAKDKKVLMLVSITYIGALFLSYFLIGAFFLAVFDKFTDQITIIGTIVNWLVLVLCFVLFSLNLYDFVQARNEKYGKIKNQLPKFVQKYNKKIIRAFTGVINNEDDKRGIIFVLGVTFLLGITLSITELVCTGQIYFGILYGIHTVDSGYAYILLIFYNVMFVLPLIIIAIFAIKLNSVVTISNWIREHLANIKLFTAIFFFIIFIFFLFRLI